MIERASADEGPGAERFERLLSPIRIGRHTIANRVLMGAMHMRFEHMDRPIEREAAFYAERARGGVGLIVSGGYAPNEVALLEEGAQILINEWAATTLRPIPRAVHAEGGKILLQVLHPGRYANHAAPVGASSIPSHINPHPPRAMRPDEIEQTIADFARCAELAAFAGYDGVEIMASEGYLLNQFTVRRTNNRTDEWGGSLENRHRFPIEVVKRTRERLGPDFLIMYRISGLDLVEDGASGYEVQALARAIEAAGADVINTGIGWYESRVPTIAYMVPRGAWRFASARIKQVVGIPVVASNRINTPEIAEELLRSGDADMVSMARPLLADPAFVRKSAAGRASEINTCIACNQACLDYIFSEQSATCLVNPRAGREIDYVAITPVASSKRVAVVGGGAAGLACAITAGQRGHRVTLFESQAEIGGQLNYARQVPGKQEFDELLRYFRQRLNAERIHLRLGRQPTVDELASGYDRVVIATGVRPRRPEIAGIDHPKVVFYPDLLAGKVIAGRRVAIIGAGGIGFDVAEFLLHAPGPDEPGPDDRAGHPTSDADDAMTRFFREWGVDTSMKSAGGVKRADTRPAARSISLLQRKPGKLGRTLGLTTGWALKSSLSRHGVELLSACEYLAIDDAGLHLRVAGEPRLLEVDTIVICAGQESELDLQRRLNAAGVQAEVIGGAARAAELDAFAAIQAGTRLAMTL